MAAEVGLEILEAGPETDALLRDLALRLGFERLTPDEFGYVEITFMAASVDGVQAWEQVRAVLDATSPTWADYVQLLPLGFVAGPRVLIDSVRDTGPTGNSGDDTLYVVKLRERGREQETIRFSVADRHGRLSEQKVGELVAAWAERFARDQGAIEQFRERERPHGRDRLAVLLSPEE